MNTNKIRRSIIRVSFLMLLILLSSFSGEEKKIKKGDNTNSNTNFDYTAYYKKIETYIPDEDSPIKHVRIAFNIFTGSGTIQNTEESIAAIKQVGAWINAFYTYVDSATYPINGVPWLTDTKIRFDIDERIYFYENTKLYNSTSLANMEKYIAGVDSSRLNNLNIYITAGGNSTTYSIPPFPNFILEGSSGVSAGSLYGTQGIYISSVKPSYVNSQTLAHELGHSLDLLHTYEPSCCHETCNGTDPDYLYDLFGPNPPEYCWERGHFGCKITPGENTCTNNMMGGNNLLNYYFSPMQIGKMHRALTLKSARKYVKEDTYDATPHKIKKNEIWNFDIRWYSDIIVEPGVTLTVTGKIAMAEQAKIIVKRGATLLIDGGMITASSVSWQGISIKKRNLILKKIFKKDGQLILKNAAVLEKALEQPPIIKME